MRHVSKHRVIAVAGRTVLGAAVVLSGWLMQPAYAYDSVRLAAALDALTAQTFPDWEKQARAGDPVAQNVVGMAYKYGDVVPQNHSQSLHWFKQAAQQGDADAQFNLGRIYGKATGAVYGKQRAVPRDDVTAAFWYRKAAEQNYGPAQLNLGQMYAEGSPSFPRDLGQAYFWTQLSAVDGDQAASAQLASYLSEMRPADKGLAQQLASEWKQRHPQ
jgi:uncharacterized protein